MANMFVTATNAEPGNSITTQMLNAALAKTALFARAAFLTGSRLTLGISTALRKGTMPSSARIVIWIVPGDPGLATVHAPRSQSVTGQGVTSVVGHGCKRCLTPSKRLDSVRPW